MNYDCRNEKDFTSAETKKKLQKWAKKNKLIPGEFHTKIELIKKHRELFGSPLKEAKESIENMFGISAKFLY